MNTQGAARAFSLVSLLLPRDAESLLIDPRTGDLYIVSKASLFAADDRPVGVYLIERAARDARQARARRVADVPMGAATAGDIAPDGSVIALRNYKMLRYWSRSPGESVSEALHRPPCTVPLADEQGEALGFAADGKGMYTISEGKRQPVYFYELKL